MNELDQFTFGILVILTLGAALYTAVAMMARKWSYALYSFLALVILVLLIYYQYSIYG